MKTITYNEEDWYSVWNQIAKVHSALFMGKELGFTIRKETQLMSCDDAPVGYDRFIAVHLDFEHDEDYTMFLLRWA
jgi:hypothetical protein